MNRPPGQYSAPPNAYGQQQGGYGAPPPNNMYGRGPPNQAPPRPGNFGPPRSGNFGRGPPTGQMPPSNNNNYGRNNNFSAPPPSMNNNGPPRPGSFGRGPPPPSSNTPYGMPSRGPPTSSGMMGRPPPTGNNMSMPPRPGQVPMGRGPPPSSNNNMMGRGLPPTSNNGPPTSSFGRMNMGPPPSNGPPTSGPPMMQNNNAPPKRGPFGFMPRGGARPPPNNMQQNVPSNTPAKSPFGGPSGPPTNSFGSRGPPTQLPPPSMGAPRGMVPPSGRGNVGSFNNQPRGPPTMMGGPNQNMYGQQQMPGRGMNTGGPMNPGMQNRMGGAPGYMPGMPQQQQVEQVDEELQCDPVYMVPTTGMVPNTQQMAQKMKITMGCVVQPLAEHPSSEPVPVVNFGGAGVVRCDSCRAYINPFVKFVENGRRWKCNMCGKLNEVKKQYFCHLDGSGKRMDLADRPELRKGQVDIVATQEYMVRPPQAPCFLFVIDVSAHAVQSGALEATVETIKNNLDKLPGNPRTQVGFITFDKVVQFYNLKHTLNAPQMMVVSDLNDIFLPIPEDLLVNLAESQSMVNQLLESLPEMFKDNTAQQAACGAAMNAASRTMRHIGGKMLVFQSSLPTIGPGALSHRDNPKLLGTQDEHKQLAPGNPFYRTIATENSRAQICVDLFLFSGSYTDVATLGNVPKYTAGNLYYYPGFHPVRDGERFDYELSRCLTREIAFEAVARVRVTKGMRITNFYGNYLFRGKDLLALPSFSADSTFSLDFVHEQPVLNSGTICLQSALLYTSSNGERRIRVNTIALPTTSSEKDVFESVKIDALCNVMMKASVDLSLKSGMSSGRTKLQNDCTDMVRAWRSGSQASMSYGGGMTPGHMPGQGQMQSQSDVNLPESIQLLPLNSMALMKGLALRGGNAIRSDERAYIHALVNNMPIPQSIPFIYPRMYALHNMDAKCGTIVAVDEDGEGPPGSLKLLGKQAVEMPEQMGLTAERLSSEGAFLLDNGVDVFMWFGRAVSPKLIQDLFGLDSLDGIDCSQLRLEPGGNDVCDRVNNIVRGCRAFSPIQSTIRVVQEGGPLEMRFFMHMVEDRANFPGGAFSYAEFMGILTRQSSGMGMVGNTSTLPQRRY